MGDVGSLALGGGIGAVAVLAKQEILLVLVGGLFVLEALSVIIQVASFKLRGKRVFRMSPLHHHFELQRLGRAEGDRPVLDPVDPLRPALAVDPEAAMRAPWRHPPAASSGCWSTAWGSPAAPRRACCSPAASPCWRSTPRPADKLDLGDLAQDPKFELLPGGEPSELPPPAGGIDAVIVSPGVPMDKPLLEDARRRGVPVHRRGRAGRAVPERPDRGDHRQQRQEHHDRLDRRHAARRRHQGRGLRQHRRAAGGHDRRPAGPRLRGRAVELPDRGDRRLSSRAPRRCSTSPRTTSTATARWPPTPRPRSGSSVTRTRTASRCSTPTIPRPSRSRPAPASASSRAADRVADGCWVEGRPGGRGHAGRAGVRALPGLRRAARRRAEPGERHGGGAAGAGDRRRARGAAHRAARLPGACRTAWSGSGERAASSSTTTPRGPTRRRPPSRSEGFEDGTVHLILGGRNKGADLARADADRAAEGPPRLPDRRVGGRLRSGARRGRAAGALGDPGARRALGGRAGAGRARPWCSRRPAPASTSSATSSTAARSSRPSSAKITGGPHGEEARV